MVGAVVILISLKSGKDCKEICSHLDRWTFQTGIKQNSPSPRVGRKDGTYGKMGLKLV